MAVGVFSPDKMTQNLYSDRSDGGLNTLCYVNALLIFKHARVYIHIAADWVTLVMHPPNERKHLKAAAHLFDANMLFTPETVAKPPARPCEG